MMAKDNSREMTSRLAFVMFSLATASPALAQEASPSAPAGQGSEAQAQSSDTGLADIVVTAQRRSESAQSVPIAITAFSGDQLAKVGLASSADLVTVVPGLTMNPTGVRSPIFLRGVGNNGTSTSPSVLTFIDGVYQPFDGTGADFSNIQSIEVAKGPQGTLFGRNATGGVIQITTKNPFDWQGLDMQLGYANYDTLSAKIYGSAKLSDAVAADIAGFYDNQNDGWGVNRFDGSDAYTAKRYGTRSKIVAELDDSFKATITADYAYRWGQVGVGISKSRFNGTLFNSTTQQTFSLPSYYDFTSDFLPFYKTKEAGAALTLEKELADIKLLSISSYRGANETLRVDFDGNSTSFSLGGPSAPFFNLAREDKRRSFTQEFQLSGSSGPITWVGGLYYYHMFNDINGPRFSGFIAPLGFGTAGPDVPYAISSVDKTDAYAAYAQVTAELGAATRLTLGARYTIEKRQITGQTTGSPFLSPGSAGHQEETFKKPNFRVALDHKFTPDILGYASWSRGFNAGFFNQISVLGFNDAVNPVVKPEGIDAYEVGIKSDLLDRHLRVNIAAFLYDYSNLQQQIYKFGGISTVNAASARIKGIDFDIVARPVRDLTLSFSANYLDAKYRSYPLAPNYIFLPSGEFAVPGTSSSIGSPVPGAPTIDAAGNRLVSAPKFGLQASATYSLRTDIGTFDTTANLNYQTKQYADPQNNYVIPGRTLVGLTEQWTSNDGKTTITAWAKNLTNKVYDVSYSLLTPVGLVGNPGAPRTYGITVGRKF